MTIAYANKLTSGISYGAFITRRYFRLSPLYCLVLLSRNPFGQHIGDLLLNISFMFGFANPNITSMVAGGWSLGIEFVFYLLFPLFVVLSASRWRWPLLLLALVMQTSFTHGLLHTEADFIIMRAEYGQFIAFGAYFLGGCIIGRIADKRSDCLGSIIWIRFAGLLAFLIIAAMNTSYLDLGNFLGALIAATCILLVFFASKLHFTSGGALITDMIGAMSYGLYLLHPRVFAWLSPTLSDFPEYVSIPTIILTTIGLALIVEKHFERPIKKWGYNFLKSKCM